MLQDNKSSILLERNGKPFSGKHMSHISICYFFITDRGNMKDLTIEWCPTKQMAANFMTKPLQGSSFRYLRDYIMGRMHSRKPKREAVSVVKKNNSKKKKLIERSMT